MTHFAHAVPTAEEAQGLARIGGLAYLAIFILAIAANFFVLQPLGVRDDAAATAAGIAAAEQTYRLGVAAMIAVLIADVVVGWALFIVLRPADASLSLLVLLFRVAYTVAHIGVLLTLMSALTFATVPPFAAAMGPNAAALSYHFFASHDMGSTVTLIFFGVHLVLLGRLVSRSGFMPRALGWLLTLAGVGYAANGFGVVILGSFGAYANAAALAMIVPALIGEGAFTVWLLVWGVNRARYPAAD